MNYKKVLYTTSITILLPFSFYQLMDYVIAVLTFRTRENVILYCLHNLGVEDLKIFLGTLFFFSCVIIGELKKIKNKNEIKDMKNITYKISFFRSIFLFIPFLIAVVLPIMFHNFMWQFPCENFTMAGFLETTKHYITQRSNSLIVLIITVAILSLVFGIKEKQIVATFCSVIPKKQSKGSILLGLFLGMTLAGIIVSIAVPNHISFIKNREVEWGVCDVGRALETYARDHNGNYPTTSEVKGGNGIGDVLIKEGYLKVYPQNPFGKVLMKNVGKGNFSRGDFVYDRPADKPDNYLLQGFGAMKYSGEKRNGIIVEIKQGGNGCYWN